MARAACEKRRFTSSVDAALPCARARPTVRWSPERIGTWPTPRQHAPKEIQRPGRDRQGRTPRARRACRPAHAVDQHRQPLQYRPAAIAISRSSPENDRLAYITRAEVVAFLDEIAHERLPVREIGFTGGEPFMNPDIIAMLGDALERGFQVLLLTNAMQPMQRPRIRDGPAARCARRMASGLLIRVSLDHYDRGAARYRARCRVLRQDN